MTFVLIFIGATAALIVLFLVKIRAMQKHPDVYLRKLERSTQWYQLEPEALDRNLRRTADSVIKPALHTTLVTGFALYKNASIAITKFMRRTFYNLLHYSLKRGDEKKPRETESLRKVHTHNTDTH